MLPARYYTPVKICQRSARMQKFDETIEIDTPENVVFGYRVAGIGSRFLGALVDSVLIVLLQVITFSLVFTLLAALDLYSLDDETALAWGAAIIGLISFVFLWGYYIFFELLWNGQSPGKRLANLRVMRMDGMPVTMSEILVRNLVRVVDFLPFFYGIGVVTMFINRQSRRLGDLAAGTLVVHEETRTISLDSLRIDTKASSSFRPTLEGVGALPVEMLTDQDIELIRSYLARRDAFSNANELALRILNRLLLRMELPAAAISSWQADRVLQAILRVDRDQLDSG